MNRFLPTTNRDYWTTWFAAVLFFAAFYTLFVPLPLYLTDVGIPDWQIAVILGAFGVASLVGRPLAGALTDRWGFRPLILFGTLALAVGALGVTLTTSPVVLFVLRISQAAGYVAFSTAATALVAELAPAARRGAAIAVFGLAANVAITLVPASVSAGLNVLTIRGALWLCSGLAILAGLVAWLANPKPRSRTRAVEWRQLLRVPSQLLLPMITTALFGIGFGTFYQLLPLLGERRHLEPIGLAYTVYGVAIIMTRLTTGRLLDGEYRLRIMQPAFGLLMVGLLGFAGANSMPLLLSAAGLVAIGSGILHPALIAMHVELTPPEQRGRAAAAFYLAFDLGIGMGSWILSPVFQQFGLTGVFLAGAGIVVMGLFPLARIRRLAKQTSP